MRQIHPQVSETKPLPNQMSPQTKSRSGGPREKDLWRKQGYEDERAKIKKRKKDRKRMQREASRSKLVAWVRPAKSTAQDAGDLGGERFDVF